MTSTAPWLAASTWPLGWTSAVASVWLVARTRSPTWAASRTTIRGTVTARAAMLPVVMLPARSRPVTKRAVISPVARRPQECPAEPELASRSPGRRSVRTAAARVGGMLAAQRPDGVRPPEAPGAAGMDRGADQACRRRQSRPQPTAGRQARLATAQATGGDRPEPRPRWGRAAVPAGRVSASEKPGSAMASGARRRCSAPGAGDAGAGRARSRQRYR